MTSALIGAGFTLAGSIISLLLWTWRKAERKAGAMEKEMQLAWKTARASRALLLEEQERHEKVEKLLRARAGDMELELNQLVKKVEAEGDSPALRAAVRDMLNRVLGVPKPVPPNADPSPGEVPPGDTPDPERRSGGDA